MRLDTYEGLIENKEKRMGVSHWLFSSLLYQAADFKNRT